MTIAISVEAMRDALLTEQTVERAARRLGISRSTFFARMKADPSITRGLRYRRVLIWERKPMR